MCGCAQAPFIDWHVLATKQTTSTSNLIVKGVLVLSNFEHIMRVKWHLWPTVSQFEWLCAPLFVVQGAAS